MSSSEDYTSILKDRLRKSIELKQKVLFDDDLMARLQNVVEICLECYQEKKGTIFFAGNGGSAADAQHLAAELVSRFYIDRPGLPAMALHVNTSTLTAVANDYAYDQIFSKQLEAFAKAGDVFFGLSTSGNSANVVKALEYCRRKKVTTVGFTGETGGKMKELCDVLINVASTDTPRIQEAHMNLGHTICEILEARLFL
ncbi:MAG: D-sedoheptulose 7-phosphate isomerase [Deltaproteobacteria bacterium]|nr:D-sedoheptulose 7-phosphate isomerase [Deltaproteobacteria bacterium]